MAKSLTIFKTGARRTFEPLGRALVRIGISPDAITVLGTAGVVFGGVFFAARGHYIAGTVVITLCALLDVVDGAMARARGFSTKFGALLDSSMDRVADGALFGGVAFWFASQHEPILLGVTLFCLAGGQVVSYVKARAEGLGFECNVGIAERLERLVLLGVGGLLRGFGVSWGLAAALWVLAVLTLITIFQRLLYVRAQDRAQRAAASRA